MVSDEYRVNYSEITKIYRNERKEPLAEIPPDFYAKARAYIEELRTESKSAPGTEYAVTASAQIRETVKLLRHIWEFRTRKLLLLAVSQRKQEDYEIRGLADEEKEFFTSARKLVRAHEDTAMRSPDETVHPARAAEEAAAGQAGKEVQRTDGDSVHVSEEHPRTASSEDTPGGNKMLLIRFVSDIPEFTTEFGSIRASRGDVANLPERYAKILIEREAAVIIDTDGR